MAAPGRGLPLIGGWAVYGLATEIIGVLGCLTMLGDGVIGKKSNGTAPDDVEVVDVASVLLRSVLPE